MAEKVGRDGPGEIVARCLIYGKPTGSSHSHSQWDYNERDGHPRSNLSTTYIDPRRLIQVTVLATSNKVRWRSVHMSLSALNKVIGGPSRLPGWESNSRIRTLHFKSSRTLPLGLGKGLRAMTSLKSSFLHYGILLAQIKLDLPKVSGKSLVFSKSCPFSIVGWIIQDLTLELSSPHCLGRRDCD